MKIFEDIRGFLKGALKISLAMVVAVVVFSVLGWGVWGIFHYKEKLEAEKYEVAKTWRSDVKQYLQMDLVTKTKLVDGRMRASLQLDGYPAYLSHPRLQAKNSNGDIILS